MTGKKCPVTTTPRQTMTPVSAVAIGRGGDHMESGISFSQVIYFYKHVLAKLF